MKKLISILLVVAMVLASVFTLTACIPEYEITIDTENEEIAMVTDSGDITDKSFNQSTWEAVKAFGEKYEVSTEYYKPAGEDKADYVTSIEQAINAGATVVVTPGYKFETAIFEIQDDYADVKFILLDGKPNNGAYDDTREEKVADNTYSVFYQEEIAGYLAGYAAVKDGETALSFLGGMAVPAVQRFGFGYVQGAQDAAKELDVTVDMWYAYGGQFFGSPEIKSVMDSWFTAGMNTIFACGGGIYTSAADAIITNEGGNLIGVDVNQQPSINATPAYADINVMTSAMKGLQESTTAALEAYFADQWATVGGKSVTLGLSEDGSRDYVGLPTDDAAWNFEKYTVEDYNALVDDIRDGEVTIDSDNTTDIEAWIKAATNLEFKAYIGSING